MSRYSDQVTAKTGTSAVAVPLANPSIYVYKNGALAALTDDSGAALPNPFVADQYGNFAFNAIDGLYDLRIVYGGEVVYEQDGLAVGTPHPRAVLLIYYGQSLSAPLAPAVTVGGINGLFMFNGGIDKNLWPDYANTGGEQAQNIANMGSMVPFLAPSTTETPIAGCATKILKEPGVTAVLGFGAGLGSQSLRLLRPGTNNFIDLKNGVCLGVKFLEAAGYSAEVRVVFVQGHADADTINDGQGTGAAETTTAQWLSGVHKIYNGIVQTAQMALGRPVPVTMWLVPMTTGSGGGQYTPTGIANVIEGQRQAVATVPGIKWGPAFSQFATRFNADLVHPLGAIQRLKGEADGLVMSRVTFAPPQMVGPPAAIDATHTDVTFDQDVSIDPAQTDATGFPNSCKGFDLFIGSTQYAVTSVAQTGTRTFRLTHASCSTSGRIVKNGCQWVGTTGTAATLMARTFVIGTVDIGVAEDGTALRNYAISQVIQ